MLKGITVRTEFEAFHYWQDAPEEVAFLRNPHRHIFKVSAFLQVFESDRELEFFMVKKVLDSYLESNYKGKTFSMGCEHIATDLVKYLQITYSERRSYVVEVAEDGENSGSVAIDAFEKIITKE